MAVYLCTCGKAATFPNVERATTAGWDAKALGCRCPECGGGLFDDMIQSDLPEDSQWTNSFSHLTRRSIPRPALSMQSPSYRGFPSATEMVDTDYSDLD